MPSPTPLRDVLPFPDALQAAQDLVRCYYFIHVFHLAHFLALMAIERDITIQNRNRADTAFLQYARDVMSKLPPEVAKDAPSNIPELAPGQGSEGSSTLPPGEQDPNTLEETVKAWKDGWKRMQGSAATVPACYCAKTELHVDRNISQSERYTQFYALTSVRMQLDHAHGICRELQPFDLELYTNHVAFARGNTLYCTKENRYHAPEFDGPAELAKLLEVAGGRTLALIFPLRLRPWQQGLSDPQNPKRRHYGDFF